MARPPPIVFGEDVALDVGSATVIDDFGAMTSSVCLADGNASSRSAASVGDVSAGCVGFAVAVVCAESSAVIGGSVATLEASEAAAAAAAAELFNDTRGSSSANDQPGIL